MLNVVSVSLMLGVICNPLLLSVIKLNVVMLNVVMLNVVAPNININVHSLCDPIWPI
jgi:hypothetical protein